MYIHTNIHNNILKFKNVFNKDYKTLLTYTWSKDNIGLCELIDEWTDKNYNVYQKFILMLHLYRECINDKLVYEINSKKYIFYLDDIIEKLPEINAEQWVSIGQGVDILIQFPFNFYNKNISEDTQITTGEMNEYFVNNCITHIRIGENIQKLTKDEINLLPSDIFNKAANHIKSIDMELQKINLFGSLNLPISVFTMLTILKFIFKVDRNNFIEFEYAMRRHVKMTNFDDITYRYAHDIADVYSHELQEQRDAIEDAKNKAQQ